MLYPITIPLMGPRYRVKITMFFESICTKYWCDGEYVDTDMVLTPMNTNFKYLILHSPTKAALANYAWDPNRITHFKKYQEMFNNSDINTEVIGYKKVKLLFNAPPQFNNIRQINTCIIAALIIPKGARRNITDCKCRAERAIITGYFNLDMTPFDKDFTLRSIYSPNFVYPKVGGTVQSRDRLGELDFDEGTQECTTGIHFFTELKKAIKY